MVALFIRPNVVDVFIGSRDIDWQTIMVLIGPTISLTMSETVICQFK